MNCHLIRRSINRFFNANIRISLTFMIVKKMLEGLDCLFGQKLLEEVIIAPMSNFFNIFLTFYGLND